MAGKITIVGLGPGSTDMLTLSAHAAIMGEGKLILRTARHEAAEYLKQNNREFVSLDEYYERVEDFDELWQTMAQIIVSAAEEEDVVYAVPGHGLMDDEVSGILAESADVQIIPGISDAANAAAKAKQNGLSRSGIVQMPASLLNVAEINPNLPLIVTQLDDKLLTGVVKWMLSGTYEDDCPVTMVFPWGEKRCELWQIDQQDGIDHRTCLILPAFDERYAKYPWAQLGEIMASLRAPDGCPWDRQQTHRSLRRYLLEEAYEAIQAMDDDDPWELCEELGDVLFQIFFHAQIAAENGEFTIADVVDELCRKLRRRHPHVFENKAVADADEVSANWDEIKRNQEKDHVSRSRMMKDLPGAMPALLKAAKVRKYYRLAGLKEPDLAQAMAELIDELENRNDAEETLGKVLFVAAALCAQHECDPEIALTKQLSGMIEKFEKAELSTGDKAMDGLTPEEVRGILL